jgi:peptide deformylase
MIEISELGEPVLREPAQPILDPTSAQTRVLVDQMVNALKRERGIGIAAPQIGVSQQAFIVAPNQKINPPYTDLNTGLVVINPKISFLTNESSYEWEGCLSLPGLRGLVPRQCNIMIEYYNVDGEFKSETYTGFTARIFLHEFDHLNGVMFIDRVEDLKNQLITDHVYSRTMDND